MDPAPFPAPAPPSPEPVTRARRPQRALVALLGLLLALVVLPLAALAALHSAPARRALRARAAAELAARLPAARLEGSVGVDAAFRLVLEGVTIPGASGGPLLVIDRVALRPRLLRMLRGRVEVGAVALRGVHVYAGRRGERLAELARALQRPPARGGAGRPRPPVPAGAAAPPVFAFSGLEVRLENGLAHRPAVVLGPVGGRLHLAREEGLTRAHLTLAGPGDADGELEARLGGGRPAALDLRLRGLGAEALPERLRARLPVEVRKGAVDVALHADPVAHLAAGEAALDVTARALSLRAERLDPRPVGPVDFRVRGTLRWDVPGRRLALQGARVELGAGGDAPLDLDFHAEAAPVPRFALALTAAGVDWRALVAALPPALAPPPEAPALRGRISGALRLAGAVGMPSTWQLDGEVDPSGLAPEGRREDVGLAHGFTFDAPLARGGTREVVVGPSNTDFVPLGELPPYLVRAVLASEDAGFWGHHGFDLSEVREALAHSVDGGRLRGASTITQQLAKNLYLSRDRTLGRKVREALATVALEVALGKRRILEVYLNVIEWGDGVNGIGEAARHWFGKDARELSVKEAAFLATVIPNPVRYELYRRRGALTPAWEARVHGLLGRLRAVGALDDAGLGAAEAEELAFAAGRPQHGSALR